MSAPRASAVAADPAGGGGPGDTGDTYLTWLYVPGDRPAVVAKALRSGADVVLVDLEDAVAPERKAYALAATAELLGEPRPGPVPVHVRVNALAGPLADGELRTLAPLPGLAGLRLPKTGGREEVLRVATAALAARAGAPAPVPAPGDRTPVSGPGTAGPDDVPGPEGPYPAHTPAPGQRPGPAGADGLPAPPLGHAATGGVPPLYPLLESALGIERAYEIAAAHPAVRGIALGEADLRAELGVADDAGLAWPRSRAVVAARAAGLAPPAQSVYPDVADLEGLARSCAAGRALGFLGRTAIHPRQLPVIERAFLPTPQEVERAEEIVAAATADAGALALPDGRFVDAAVVAEARRTLRLAHRRTA
ncbi:aldolase/citrate lyase family protein [Streptomyces sp. NBC_01808]|uniref:HpcH/HpaI aldolase/citrate lyase family protein n=1 Tax=Streptomyces sp. NBC_01808 TaxID=2975947 RepID=UPI002DDA028A|nr:aldolase/citrate lyase family protein [Streptomyces sp. NBC_01808]WSA42171.1 aldolase/citrate lyase family protein [Streptomyces sp. NBC_01808]